LPDNSFVKAEYIGSHVADDAAEALQSARPVKVTRYEFFERMLRIPIANKGFEQAAQADLYHGRKPSVEGKTETPVGLISPVGQEHARARNRIDPRRAVPGVERGRNPEI